MRLGAKYVVAIAIADTVADTVADAETDAEAIAINSTVDCDRILYTFVWVFLHRRKGFLFNFFEK